MKSQRSKGQNGEREVAAILAKYGIVARRRLGQERDGGEDLDTTDNRAWEVKRRRRIAVYAWYEQAARAAAANGRVPVVAMRCDRGEWLVMLKLEDYLRETHQCETIPCSS